VTVTDHDVLARRFEQKRSHLQAVAFRMLGSRAEADDAVQEAWLRLSRTEAGELENLGGWLTTVVARVCLDVLRSRRSRKEGALDDSVPEASTGEGGPLDPEEQVVLADSVGPALLVVLETLGPSERLAFVLHDMFGVAFEEIASIVGATPAAARQLASRARRRVQGAGDVAAPDRARQREVVRAFLAASRDGDFQALLELLDPEVVFRADDTALQLRAAAPQAGGPHLAPEMRGAHAVAAAFSGKARGAQAASIDGAPGFVWAPGGTPRAVFRLTFEGGRVAAIDLVADPATVASLGVVIEG
jgi:RNA polymerase sigma-70 factor (ECF subfamily)